MTHKRGGGAACRDITGAGCNGSERRGRKPDMIYLDHNATTPLDSDVLAEMMPFLNRHFGNPSSLYSMGRQAKQALDIARSKTAACIGASPEEVIFTSSGTESDNTAIYGAARALKRNGAHIITTAVEHKAVLNTCHALERDDFRLTLLNVTEDGVVDPAEVEQNITADTILVSVMLANNETGVIQPIRDIADILKKRGIVFHCDGVQAAGKIPISVGELGVDMLSLSAHKFYGPKGIGALYIRKATPFIPLLNGGQQEQSLRPGTENVAFAVGLAKALEKATGNMPAFSDNMSGLRNRLEDGIQQTIDRVMIHGKHARRVPNTSNISFLGVDGESLLVHLDLNRIAVSTGSACAAGGVAPSHVLAAMGVPPQTAQSALRFSFGSSNTRQEVDRVMDILKQTVEKLRRISSV